MKDATYENYPYTTVLISNLHSIAIYAISSYIILRFGFIPMALYILYIIFLEIRVLKKSCVNCFYYGKRCAFGKGMISSLIFKKGDTQAFAICAATWKEMVPFFLSWIMPMIAAVAVLIMEFSWLILILTLLLVILGTAGNGYVRGTLACRFCKQRELGCPAEKLFCKK